MIPFWWLKEGMESRFTSHSWRKDALRNRPGHDECPELVTAQEPVIHRGLHPTVFRSICEKDVSVRTV
jgi:hypothetical protein